MKHIIDDVNLNILVVENIESRLEIFNKMFKEHNLTVSKNAASAIKLLDKEEFDIIFLSHDLNGRLFESSDNEGTGYQVAKHIKENEIKYREIIVHSMNNHGANLIKKYLHCTKIPFNAIKSFL